MSLFDKGCFKGFSKRLVVELLVLMGSSVFTFLLLSFFIPILPIFKVSAQAGIYSNPELLITPSSPVNINVELGLFNSATQTISVSTTNYTGYTVTMVANGSTADLVNVSDNTLTIPSVLTSTAQQSLNNNYGYAVGSSATMNPIPVGTADTIATTNAANLTPNTYDLIFGIHADLNTIAGTYQKTFTISAVSNPGVLYSVTYNKNTTDTVSGMPDNVVSANNGSPSLTFTPSATVPVRDGYYALAGWAQDPAATTPECDSNTPCHFTLDPDTANQLTLYAVWESTAIQNYPDTSCTTTPKTLYDTRDGHAYVIQRLNDGNCWMMENLDLGRTTLTTDLTSANTNLTTTVTASTFNGWKRTSGTQSYTTGVFVVLDGSDSTSNSSYGTLYNYYATTAGTISGATNSSTATNDICPAGWRLPTGGSAGEFANLYSYYNSAALMRASIANSGAAFALPGYFTSSTANYQGSRGYYWSSTRTSNSSNAYSLLVQSSSVFHNSSSTRNSGRSIRCILKKPNTHSLTVSYDANFASVSIDGVVIPNHGQIYLVQGASHSISVAVNEGYSFTGWTATSGIIGSASAQTTTFTIGSSDAILSGSTVFSGTYLQDVDDSLCTSDVHIYYDNRDMKTYQVQRLQDGRCWMLDNLTMYNISTDLTSSNTNLATTISAATFNSWQTGSTTSASLIDSGEYTATYANTVDSTSHTRNGVLYNYYAASAGTVSTSKHNSMYDICPAGWRLATNEATTGEYRILASYYDTNELVRNRPELGGAAFSLSGEFHQYGFVRNAGYYWANTAGNQTNSKAIGTTGGLGDPMIGRIDGCAVRCILKQSTTSVLTVSYGSDVSDVIINGVSIPNGGTLTLEQGFQSTIYALPSNGRAFLSWSATSGTIEASNYQFTKYTIGSSNATLSVSTQPGLQNLPQSSCTTTPGVFYDGRDGQSYTIQRLNDGNCWLMENLRLGKYSLAVDLDSTNTNIINTITNSTFNGWVRTSFSNSTTTGVITENTGTDSTSGTDYGYLYNYYAASAGSIRDNIGYDLMYDICPAGWRLPTGGSTSEFRSLTASYSNSSANMRASIANGGAAFAFAGHIGPKSYITDQDSMGYYWSSTARSSTSSYDLELLTSQVINDFTSDIRYGQSLRCIMKNPTHTITFSLGTGISNAVINNRTYNNGDTIELEEGREFVIGVNLAQNYSFSNWSATSGTINSSSSQFMSYTVGASNATLTATATDMSSATVMQNLSYSSCTSTPSKVKDNRDNHIYTIQRLNDGNCWMMDNLDLGRFDLTSDLTSQNTNISTSISASTFNGWKKTAATYGQSTTAGNFVVFNNGDEATGTPYGTIYNYFVASGGAISGDSNLNIAEYDICPAGWRLPTGDTAGEIGTLYDNYPSASTFVSPISSGGLAFTKSGECFSSSCPAAQRVGGYWWSSTPVSSIATSRFILSVLDNIRSDAYLPRGYSTSIRCKLIRPKHTLTVSYGSGVSGVSVNGSSLTNGGTIVLEEGEPVQISLTTASTDKFYKWSATSGTVSSSIYRIGTSDATLSVAEAAYLQDIVACSDSPNDTTASLIDNRDNQTYVVKKFDDGNCWMVTNLNLGATTLSTGLDSSNTNISGSISASTFNGWKKTTSSYTYTASEYIPVSGTDSVSNTPYGVLYNYCAASGGTICDASITTNATEDICPAGWRLPTYPEQVGLYNKYNSSDLLHASLANNGAAFAFAGRFTNSTPNSQDSMAFYWASNRKSNTARATLYSTTTSVSTNYTFNRRNGASIRCIIK